ncbi:MAG: PIN domain-containing protein [Ktedonobacteraceae bacterium]
MGWVDTLHGKIVGVDTAPFIYYIERNPLYIDMLRTFFQAVNKEECTVMTSIVTLLETLVIPIRNADVKLAQKYRNILLDSEGLTTVFLDQNIAEQAARLRASYNIRTPDSIQLATAIIGKASFFLTNDKQLPSLPNITTLVLDDLKKEP